MAAPDAQHTARPDPSSGTPPAVAAFIARDASAWGRAMIKALGQAERYARSRHGDEKSTFMA